MDDKYFIFDSLRKKLLALTPEEWVRQHWINFLIDHQGYPKGLISLEKGLKYNQLQKRTDLVVFDREGHPYLLIECKAPEVELSQKVLQQALAYRSTLLTPYIILSNGKILGRFIWNKLCTGCGYWLNNGVSIWY